MTTIAQVKQAVQPLLQRNPDLALIGRLVIIKPVRHILCGVYIDRSLDHLLFVPTWSVLLLCQPQRDFGYLWGARVSGPRGLWRITDPDLPAAMCEAIEQEALAPMRAIKTFDDFASFACKERFPVQHLDLYPQIKVLVDIARGDLVAASAICKDLQTKQALDYVRIVKTLCPLIAANNRAALAKILHEQEAQSVKNLKIEKYWEPTPFPIEAPS